MTSKTRTPLPQLGQPAMSSSNWSAADPNEVYSLVELLGEGSYGCVYKAGRSESASPPDTDRDALSFR